VFVLCDLRQREGGDFKFIEMEQQPSRMICWWGNCSSGDWKLQLRRSRHFEDNPLQHEYTNVEQNT
jgi:hypothetical protein